MSISAFLLHVNRNNLLFLNYARGMNDYFDTFRFNVKYYRDLQKLSQSALAIQVNCSNGLIGNIEAGKAHPSFETIVAIAEALHVHPADLFLRDSSKSKSQIKEYLKNTLHREIDKIIETSFPE